MKYLPKTNLSETEIRAGLDAGTLRPWRIDASGVPWFMLTPLQRGVPSEPTDRANSDGARNA